MADNPYDITDDIVDVENADIHDAIVTSVAMVPDGSTDTTIVAKGGSDDTPTDALETVDMVTIEGQADKPVDHTNHVLKEEKIIPPVISECALTNPRDGVKAPCASDEAIATMKDMLGGQVRPGASKKEILESVKKKLDVKDERSVVMSNEFVQRMGRDKAARELKKNFKVAGPTDVSLLNNFNIDETLQQWAHAHPDFFAYNFNMRDYESHGDTLYTVDVADLYREGYRAAACVINSDVYAGRGKHWMALFMDARRDDRWTVEFFNSSGNPPVVEFCNWLIKTKHQLQKVAREKGITPRIDVIRTSTICHQKSRTECGVYSLYYIYSRLKGIDWEYFAKHPISDTVMFEFRHHLFWDKRRPSPTAFNYENYKKNTKILWE